MFDSCWSIYFLAWNNIWGFIDRLTSAWMLQIPAWLASHNDSIVFLITFEEDCCSMTWGKLGGEKKKPSSKPILWKLLILQSSKPALINLHTHTQLPLPQVVGTTPQRQGGSPHLKAYSRLHVSLVCGGKKKKIALFTRFGIESKNLVMFFFFLFYFFRRGSSRWQLPVGCHLVPSYLCSHRWVVLQIAFPLLSPLGNL